jgi:hypothetical protein
VFNSVSEIFDLQQIISDLEKENDTNVNEKIAAHKCVEELRKRLKESTV